MRVREFTANVMELIPLDVQNVAVSFISAFRLDCFLKLVYSNKVIAQMNLVDTIFFFPLLLLFRWTELL